MNLPEPSGSSPPEKPPGMKTICAVLSFSAKLSTLRAMPSAERLLTTKISASAPASRTALALSYSQLVPGKAGISTFGFAHLIAGATRLSALKEKVSMGWSKVGILQLYTPSSLFS